uniref:POTRA domain-containing protein n=1 Tax=Oncorhynchus mykiss TaxID=8022 RepID=A0A8K9XYJ3_ONCMY
MGQNSPNLLWESLDPLPMQGPELGFHADDIERPDMEQESKQEVLENKDIADVFRAKNLIDVMRRAHEARQKLLRLGIFRQVDVVIDTSQGTVVSGYQELRKD